MQQNPFSEFIDSQMKKSIQKDEFWEQNQSLSKSERNCPNLNVRKSARLQEKRKIQNQKHKKQADSFKNKNKQMEQDLFEKQYQRSMIKRLNEPSQTTSKLTQIMMKNNKFYYSINVKYEERCSRHAKQSEVSHDQVLNFSGQSEDANEVKNCSLCIKIGQYWFSEVQLRQFNNGAYFRRFIEQNLLD